MKAELEAELGLKIVQTGVGEVGARRGRPSGPGWATGNVGLWGSLGSRGQHPLGSGGLQAVPPGLISYPCFPTACTPYSSKGWAS